MFVLFNPGGTSNLDNTLVSVAWPSFISVTDMGSVLFAKVTSDFLLLLQTSYRLSIKKPLDIISILV